MQLKIVNWKIGLKKLKQKNKEMEILWDIVFVWEPRGQTLKEWFAFRRCISESSQKDIIKVKHGWAEGEFELWCNSKRGLSQSCRSSGNGSAFQRCPNLRQDLGCLPSFLLSCHWMQLPLRRRHTLEQSISLWLMAMPNKDSAVSCQQSTFLSSRGNKWGIWVHHRQIRYSLHNSPHTVWLGLPT